MILNGKYLGFVVGAILISCMLTTALRMTIKSIDFEVYGRVQGVFFRKFTKKEADALGLKGWVMNTESDTVVGQLQGPEQQIKKMKMWLESKGSPASRIDKAVFKNEAAVASYTFNSFDIRR